MFCSFLLEQEIYRIVSPYFLVLIWLSLEKQEGELSHCSPDLIVRILQSVTFDPEPFSKRKQSPRPKFSEGFQTEALA